MTTSNEHNNAPAVPQGEPVAWMVYGNYTRQPFGMLCSAEAYMRGLLKSDPDGGYHIRPLRYTTPAPAPAQGEPFGHFRVEPFGWTDCAATDDGAIALYEHPMTNPWRDAVIEQLESWHIYVPAIHDNSPRLAIKALVNMECKAALDPAVSSEAAALAAQGVQAHTPAVPQGLPAFDDLDDDVIDAACTAGSLLYRVDLMRAYECIRKALAATPAPEPAQERCHLCDCTGDSVDQIGEWRGECPYCKPAQEVGLTGPAVAWRMRDTGFRRPKYVYFDTKEQAVAHAAHLLQSRDDGHLTELTPLCEASTSTDLLDALRDNSWKLEPFEIPTGQGDADIGWRVVGFYMGKPKERTEATVYTDDPAAAIIAALRAKGQS